MLCKQHVTRVGLGTDLEIEFKAWKAAYILLG